MRRYQGFAGGAAPGGPLEYGPASLQATAVLRIDIEQLTGKASDR